VRACQSSAMSMDAHRLRRRPDHSEVHCCPLSQIGVKYLLYAIVLVGDFERLSCQLVRRVVRAFQISAMSIAVHRCRRRTDHCEVHCCPFSKIVKLLWLETLNDSLPLGVKGGACIPDQCDVHGCTSWSSSSWSLRSPLSPIVQDWGQVICACVHECMGESERACEGASIHACLWACSYAFVVCVCVCACVC
jgi:hypothetical protein